MPASSRAKEGGCSSKGSGGEGVAGWQRGQEARMVRVNASLSSPTTIWACGRRTCCACGTRCRKSATCASPISSLRPPLTSSVGTWMRRSRPAGGTGTAARRRCRRSCAGPVPAPAPSRVGQQGSSSSSLAAWAVRQIGRDHSAACSGNRNLRVRAHEAHDALDPGFHPAWRDIHQRAGMAADRMPAHTGPAVRPSTRPPAPAAGVVLRQRPDHRRTVPARRLVGGFHGFAMPRASKRVLPCHARRAFRAPGPGLRVCPKPCANSTGPIRASGNRCTPASPASSAVDRLRHDHGGCVTIPASMFRLAGARQYGCVWCCRWRLSGRRRHVPELR